MLKTFIAVTLVMLCNDAVAQDVQFETKFSKSFAVFQFMNSLSGKSQNNVYSKLYKGSSFATPQNDNLIAQFDSLNIDYEFEFSDYPAGQKVGIDVPNLLRRNLVLSADLQDFKIRSMGLLPNEKLLKLINLLNEFAPVYDAIIYQPFHAKFEEQLKGISDLIKSSNINYYFTEALQFFNSAWDVSVPFVFTFYPLPYSRGFTATAVSNIAISAIADSLDTYNSLLSVMLHEVSHVLYDERSLALWNQMQEWFDSNPTKASRYANSLLNEAMATAVGNGYLAAQLNGREDTTRRWYGVKYINMMAKTAYPVVKEYIEAKRPMDQAFINRYIQLFEDHYSAWLYEPQFVIRGHLLLTERDSDYAVLSRIFPPAPGDDYQREISAAQLKKFPNNHATKIIIVNNHHSEQLSLIRNSVLELKDWHFNANKDFVFTHFLKDHTWLIVLNNVDGTTQEKLKSLTLIE